jgi:hypothetical protein
MPRRRYGEHFLDENRAVLEVDRLEIAFDGARRRLGVRSWTSVVSLFGVHFSPANRSGSVDGDVVLTRHLFLR